jgi:tetratricopeptide (TPR) repeat protein
MARDSASEPRDPLPGYLAGLDHAALVGLLLEAAATDQELGERLRSAAVRAGLREAGTDPVAVEAAVDAALRPVGPLDGPGARLYAEQVGVVVGVLRRILADGGADLVVRLAQQAVERFGAAAVRADDSSGELGAIAEDLAELHLDACREGRPDAAELAGWLAERHLKVDQEDVPFGIDAYAQVLGDSGLDAYSSTLTIVWDQPEAAGSPALAHRLEALHAARGDIDALVAVLAADLRHPSRHLRIAELLAAEGRVAEAVDWAERGLAAAPTGRGPDVLLLAFLAEHYGAVGRGDEAVARLREQFQRRPDHDAYLALAAAAPPESRSEQRAWALSELHRRAARPTTRSWENPASPLIEFLVADGDLDAAWAAARQYAVPHRALLRLAQLRAATHPADAVPVYRQEIDNQIEEQSRESFRAAVGWIVRLGDLYRQLGTPDEAGRLVAEIRALHHTKGSLMTELDARGL